VTFGTKIDRTCYTFNFGLLPAFVLFVVAYVSFCTFKQPADFIKFML